MAHWSQDYDAFLELETLYESKRVQWAEMKHGPDGPTGEQNFNTSPEDRAKAHAFRKNELELIGSEFARARDYWRGIGEAVDEDHPGKRTGIKIQNFIDDNGNGIPDDQEQGQ
jgi:hypothetical protein